ncbi:unnamed protein product [Caenorhabditis angaria]|uniref:Gamma-glutamyltransferase n=1 Tax=Caenorhabditis angaria TaxID=860376 RepID=A0A9P1N969_9PELO|nr:unnamed protein product [Caenorhabditis angaria]
MDDEKNDRRDDSRSRFKFDVTWIIVLVQFIVILFLIIALFAYILSRPIEFQTTNSKTVKNHELRTLPDFTTITFRRRFKTSTSTAATTTSSAKVDFSEDVNPQSESSENLDSFHAAVLSESNICSEIGRSILVRGGNAIDSAISTSFCLMMAFPNKASLGGGMLLLVKESNGTMKTIMARETAPMNTDVNELKKSPQLSISGEKSIGVPGMLNGLFRAYEKFSSGRLSWKQLIIPVLQQCVKGFEYNQSIKNEVKMLAKNNPNATNILDCSTLAMTLSDLIDYENPFDSVLYEKMSQYGYLSPADFEDYESDLNNARCTTIDNDIKVCGPGPPSLFSVLVNSYSLTKNMSNIEKVNEVVKSNINSAYKIADPIFYQLSRKFADDLMRSSKKSEYQKDLNVNFREDGSTMITVIDENNMTVSLILSLGDNFGSEVLTSSGFFMNNKLRYFDLKSENQPLSLQPGKVPTTMISPFIVLKNEQVLAISGGSDIISMVHLLRDLTHRNYDASIATPALYLSNSAILLKSHPNNQYSITGY